MPELPEVETIRRGLDEVLPGKRVRSFSVTVPKMFTAIKPAKRKDLFGPRITGVDRQGKALLIRLGRGDAPSGRTVVIHLKMTGQLIFRDAPSGGAKGRIVLAGGHPIPTIDNGHPDGMDLPGKVTHATFTFTDGSRLFYNDLRKFGYLKLVPTTAVNELTFINSLGPDPLERSFSQAAFDALLRRRPGAKLKPLLLDQTVIAGLGNIYVDESLNLARLHPLRTAGSLTKAQRTALHLAIKKVLRAALRAGGTSDNTYVTIRGERGDYLRRARVYHRVGEPCRRCGTPIERIVVVGRGTHLCPRCQRPPR
ncbi:MAG: bifunctional DNA-formamidopyrimidine glycosylase/DNA-(apurinic or apyrimidinic site) lyase [bacterium]|nr:bifunctional DNA-formamidopyrimidine glycosylase/DNA-(apurinic or apyrimidinic site) lyase [bacterium]MDZ4248445.1 bifunctional DNA-formamidopyrimidine glycosylase/DNA-(apurinic or apyrimidinic site) lyase [Patescibacteria group bacterium]